MLPRFFIFPHINQTPPDAEIKSKFPSTFTTKGEYIETDLIGFKFQNIEIPRENKSCESLEILCILS